MKTRKLAALVAAILVASGLAGCTGGSAPDGKVALTLWMGGDCPPKTCMESALVKGFEAENPDITIKIQNYPVDNYFTGLKSASLTRKGPDIAMMWAGTYMDSFEKYMVDARDAVGKKLLKSATGVAFYSQDQDIDKKVYAVPTANQFYIGFYNKKLFAAAGVDHVPTTWDQLMAAADKLKTSGVQPIVAGAVDGAPQLNPLYDWSYLAAALPSSSWKKLFDGEMKYDNKTLRAQLEKWASLYQKGYLNQDASNAQDTEEQFTSGKAAMWLGCGRFPSSRSPWATISE